MSILLRELWPTVILCASLLTGQGYAYDSGYWAPTPTSYWTTWVPSTTYTTWTTYAGVTVTITSIIPCPVTSTVIYYDCCDQCDHNCYNPPPVTYIGTTTVTSYTTTTPYPVQTITSNGLVIVVMDTTPYPQPSVVYQTVVNGNDAQDSANGLNLWSVCMPLAVIASIMLFL